MDDRNFVFNGEGEAKACAESKKNVRVYAVEITVDDAETFKFVVAGNKYEAAGRLALDYFGVEMSIIVLRKPRSINMDKVKDKLAGFSDEQLAELGLSRNSEITDLTGALEGEGDANTNTE